jgi:hypothetical protein
MKQVGTGMQKGLDHCEHLQRLVALQKAPELKYV